MCHCAAGAGHRARHRSFMVEGKQAAAHIPAAWAADVQTPGGGGAASGKQARSRGLAATPYSSWSGGRRSGHLLTPRRGGVAGAVALDGEIFRGPGDGPDQPKIRRRALGVASRWARCWWMSSRRRSLGVRSAGPVAVAGGAGLLMYARCGLLHGAAGSWADRMALAGTVRRASGTRRCSARRGSVWRLTARGGARADGRLLLCHPARRPGPGPRRPGRLRDHRVVAHGPGVVLRCRA